MPWRKRGARLVSSIAWRRFAGYLDRCWAPAYLSVFAAVLMVQLFLPPCVGMADNGDSARLTQDLRLTPNYPAGERYFQFFTPDYLRPGASTVWTPGLFTTGRFVIRAAGWIGRVKPAGHFDLRWMGFVHAWLYLLCFAFLLRALNRGPALVRWTIPAVAIWIFGDVFYVAYLNSFYLDAMGLITFLLAMAGAHAILNLDAPSWAITAYAVASMALAASKPLNAPVAVVMGLCVAIWSALHLRGTRRIAALGAGVSGVVVGVVMMAVIPIQYQYPALVDVVMVRIATTPAGQSSLSDFGLLSSDMRYAGMDAFRVHGPSGDGAFTARFLPNALRHLLWWYVRHPGSTIRFLRDDLVQRASVLRPFGDLEKQYLEKQYNAGRKSQHFCSWSDLRASSLRQRPVLIPLLYGASALLALAIFLYRPWQRFRGYGVSLGMAASLGALQFCFGSLLDATETSRHLFMFHVSTDVLILTLAAGMLVLVSAHWRNIPFLRPPASVPSRK